MTFTNYALRTVAGAACLAAAAPALATDRTEPVVIPIVSDTSTDLISTILGATLEKAGYNIEYVDADYAASFSGIQTGDLHYTVCWQSTMELCEGSTESGKAVNAGSTGISTAEGWWYPMSLKEVCPGLPDWKALKEPDCIEALATAETAPKARFVEGPADWIMPVEEMATAFDIDVEPIASGSAAALVATVSAAARRGEPVIAWGYTPHWYFMSDEGEFVEFPEYEEGCHDDPSWGSNPDATHDCNVETGVLWLFANKEFIDAEPEAAAIIEKFELEDSQLTDGYRKVDVDGVPLETVTDEWMAENEAVWQAWLK